ncbi:hypothetical protein EJ110_NYTH35029 [Nymphaea thermarum]|nr:hypothetical protein EJ110_NYTH35029 [Nymphaea thermarum]
MSEGAERQRPDGKEPADPLCYFYCEANVSCSLVETSEEGGPSAKEANQQGAMATGIDDDTEHNQEMPDAEQQQQLKTKAAEAERKEHSRPSEAKLGRELRAIQAAARGVTDKGDLEQREANDLTQLILATPPPSMTATPQPAQLAGFSEDTTLEAGAPCSGQKPSEHRRTNTLFGLASQQGYCSFMTTYTIELGSVAYSGFSSLDLFGSTMVRMDKQVAKAVDVAEIVEQDVAATSLDPPANVTLQLPLRPQPGHQEDRPNPQRVSDRIDEDLDEYDDDQGYHYGRGNQARRGGHRLGQPEGQRGEARMPLLKIECPRFDGTQVSDWDLSDKSSDEEKIPVEVLVEAAFGEDKSCHSLTDPTKAKAMRVQGYVNKTKVVVLLESGATHNFMSLEAAQKLECPIEPQTPFQVMVGDGSRLSCKGQCKDLEIVMHKTPFKVDVFVLPIGGVDIIFCIQWLEISVAESSRSQGRVRDVDVRRWWSKVAKDGAERCSAERVPVSEGTELQRHPGKEPADELCSFFCEDNVSCSLVETHEEGGPSAKEANQQGATATGVDDDTECNQGTANAEQQQQLKTEVAGAKREEHPRPSVAKFG